MLSTNPLGRPRLEIVLVSFGFDFACFLVHFVLGSIHGSAGTRTNRLTRVLGDFLVRLTRDGMCCFGDLLSNVVVTERDTRTGQGSNQTNRTYASAAFSLTASTRPLPSPSPATPVAPATKLYLKNEKSEAWRRIGYGQVTYASAAFSLTVSTRLFASCSAALLFTSFDASDFFSSILSFTASTPTQTRTSTVESRYS